MIEPVSISVVSNIPPYSFGEIHVHVPVTVLVHMRAGVEASHCVHVFVYKGGETFGKTPIMLTDTRCARL